ncbi:organic solute transporter Ostalpha-domain-containing protein [Amylocarpus encephaloides]|uniref:Organic solute transporter Ostalpha-domain-containing protein n=1 Tax=Amylocarpus encephaloides TaxID=45428 RepID=A0A9P7YL27_9HELO|nr:organic solute transporter Ostalpha-domain-containing protein [Amylocarpus encephaloides]
MGISSGTGQKLTHATIVVSGVAALLASLLSIVSVWLQTKNYRKPLLQRYVVRILLMVPIYSISSWSSIMSSRAAMFVDPIRDIYEAFTIYTFFQLLINFIGGERALIILMHGREPVHHLWPLNHVLPKVDISDPHSFLAIKRGILQYAWLKPVLGISTIIMKATGIYQEGDLGITSGYLWTGIFYNISVTMSLYSLGMFWVCMSKDLQPFRPVPKFLCIKLIIFASYWQGFFLSILVWLGAIPDNVEGYTSDTLAAAIQDALICMEMPIFAVAHWYAFSWHDYADVTISAARMPVRFAIRDAFGIRDLIEDTKETFSGNKYEYRLFDTGDDVLAHEESSSRVARMMEGMRYERGGKGKYWIPKPGDANTRTPLLNNRNGASRSRSPTKTLDGPSDYGGGDTDENLDPDEECLYERAKALEYGDWNYPVITAHEVSRERWLNSSPGLLTTSTNRNLLQPTRDNEIRRASNIRNTVEDVTRKTKRKHTSIKNDKAGKAEPKGKQKEVANGEEGRAPAMKGMLRHHSSASSSAKSERSQLVDLVVEDTSAEEADRVRARKEGSAGWNTSEGKHYVKTYGKDKGQDIREGFEPSDEVAVAESPDCENDPFAIGDGEEPGETNHWQQAKEPEVILKSKYGLEGEAFENVWGGPSKPASENP